MILRYTAWKINEKDRSKSCIHFNRPVLLENKGYYLSFKAAIPGRILPSRYSRDAPPPVDI